MAKHPIILKNVKVHNLKGVDLTLRPHELIVFTGVSGCGKSSLAFDTIYVEGQRRYIESLSTYARRYMGDLARPDADSIAGISPTIAIEQKSVGKNPRSTVGTLTNIHDYLRVLFAKIAIPHCPISGEALVSQTQEQILQSIASLPSQTKIILLAPWIRGKKGSLKDDFADLLKKGFMRVRIDQAFFDLSESISLQEQSAHDVDIVVDRLVIDKANFSRIAEAVLQALELGQGLLSVYNVATEEEQLFSKFAYAKKSQQSYPSLEPQDFSFNHPKGMCASCQGLGVTEEFDLHKVIDPKKSIRDDCCKIAGSYHTVKWGNIYDNLAKLYDFSVNTPWEELPKNAKKVFLHGVSQKWIKMRFVHPLKGNVWYDYISWKGVLYEAKKRFQEASSDFYKEHKAKLMVQGICSDCRGSRLKPYPSHARIQGKTLYQILQLTVSEAISWFSSLALTYDQSLIAHDLVQEILKRLSFLHEVGLSYLTLERSSPTLSGGEAQRVRLASHIGSGLVGATYVLDEPSIGLHPRDNTKLIRTLKRLRDLGNTVIVVEHDEEMILEADTVVDIGPGAGIEGGELLVNGSIDELLLCDRSITGAYLSQKLTIPIPTKRRSKSPHVLKILGASHHNLKNIDVDIPLETLVCITGVSGSGKSSLITDILYPYLANTLHHAELGIGKHQAIQGAQHLNKVICIDQDPIGRTPRSNPATYIKVFDDIRDLFASLKESKAQGFGPGRFSFNVPEGSCPHCNGMGFNKVDMDFMEDAWVVCSICQGKRFDEKTLSVTFKGKNIYDILELSIDEAFVFFEAQPSIYKALHILKQVGLGYMKLGQSSTTLSGGEAQRIKLAKELIRPSTGKTLYILDEPTTGLHFHDIAKLLDILQKLVDQKNSVLVIEHNMDFVKTADFVIDLGPEGGRLGGEILAQGTPEEIANLPSPTGVALKHVLERKKPSTSKKSLPLALEKERSLVVTGASQNHLKHLTVTLPQGKMTVCTGPSGSGKSSFAFETLYAEGQRRYIESLSSYARQFVKQMPKAKVESIEGLSPSIAIEQKHHAGNPRSTIGTMTEVYDYLRIVYARLGKAYCPETGEEIQTVSQASVIEKLLEEKEGTRLTILAPITLQKNQTFETLKDKLQRDGFLKIRLNGTYLELDEPIVYDTRLKNELFLVIDRILVKDTAAPRLHEAIENAGRLGQGIFIVVIGDKDTLFNLSFSVASTGKSYPPITPRTFSFNAEDGMCMECLGLGIQWGANLLQHPTLMEMSAFDLLEALLKDTLTKTTFKLFMDLLTNASIDPDKPLKQLSQEELHTFLHGSTDYLLWKGISLRFRGLYPTITQAAKAGSSFLKKTLLPLLQESVCVGCQGSRLNALARHVKLQGITLPALCEMPIASVQSFMEQVEVAPSHQKIMQEPIEQLRSRLHFLCAIGLDYLSLHRSAPTLSGGETQRIYLARQLGSGLTGTLYVLDEPTIGLHPHDNHKLNQALQHLKELGNTLLVVEHDPLTMAMADYILDFGPGAGKHGGEILAKGTLEEIKTSPLSLTGQYLSHKKNIALPKKRRSSQKWLEIKNTSVHNLKNLSLNLQVGTLTCITGVSGSGKSTLLYDVIYKPLQESLHHFSSKQASAPKGAEYFDKVLCMDQNPIGHTIRADISTYTDLLTPLRQFYAGLPLAAAKGLQPRHFSFNHKKGMCKTCQGLGYTIVDLQFLPSVKVPCEACHGLRLNPLSLQVKYQGRNLGELLKCSVEEAKTLFPSIPKVQKILAVLESIGLGYLELSQELVSVSGGEAQRLRLSKELTKRSTGKTLYLLDEPTTGLHMEDIKKLLTLLHRLVDQGNTVILIEHHLDVIAQADDIIDLGPKGGSEGGYLIAQGPPEALIHNPLSLTGHYLQPIIKSSQLPKDV
ncbi:MAG: excinuclease ABC subunit UvrA [Chlamydiae bacterium]|nr:excinuclease ABC subunit UvrA [Chlamydiota bacterium]